MPRPCPHARTNLAHPNPNPPPVRGPVDALALVSLAAATPARAETICLLMDASRRGGTCVVVDGTEADDVIHEIAELVIGGVADSGVVDAVVLATVRPGRPSPTNDDHWRWFELRDLFDDAGIDLLDWFVLGEEAPVSMAELTDSRSLW